MAPQDILSSGYQVTIPWNGILELPNYRLLHIKQELSELWKNPVTASPFSYCHRTLSPSFVLNILFTATTIFAFGIPFYL